MIFTTIQPPQKESTLIHKYPPSFVLFILKTPSFPLFHAHQLRNQCAAGAHRYSKPHLYFLINLLFILKTQIPLPSQFIDYPF